MSLLDDTTIANASATGATAHALLRELFPLLRSITGAGLRATVARLGQVVPLTASEVPSGTQVFDWVVPDEWSITEAYLEDEDGKRWVDLRHSALHVVSYSTPVDAMFTLAELQPHLHSLPEQPDVIPYRTTYYNPSWGFCLADRVRKAMPDGRYRAVIRSAMAPGSLTLAEHHHRGTSENEILVFAHDCHPALANDNLSGLVVAALLAAHLQGRKTRYSYRFVFAPATIGSITWLSQNYAQLHRVRHGLVLSLLGGGGPFHYKQSRDGNNAIDRTAWRVVQAHHPDAKLLPFLPWGYDERQFCSVGLNLPVGRLTRTPNGEFPEYHTSGDNPDFVKPAELAEAWLLCLRIFAALEGERSYVTLAPYGEPQLGRRGLYRKTGGEQQIPERQLAILWVLNQSDGRNSLADIATRAGLPLSLIESVADDLEAAGLLARA